MKLKQPDIKGLDFKNLNKDQKVTPMISQYLEVKNRHKEYLLFYRMGDFYELFFQDAKIAANELGIALTKRGKLGDEDIPMCGVPSHSAQTYLSRLINSGYKVAIAEQLEPGIEHSNKPYKKIFKRDVVRIITPGTILEDNLLDSKSYNNLLSIAYYKGYISLSWLDMTTGKIKLQNISGKDFIYDFYEAMNKIDPCEIISTTNLNSNVFGSKIELIKDKLTEVAESFFDIKNNKLKIKEFFRGTDVVIIDELSDSDISSIGALINYLELTQKNNIPHVTQIEIVNVKKYMQIDNFSFNSLEIFKNADGENKGCLIKVLDQTKTSMGARLLREFLKFPLIDINKIAYRQNLVNLLSKSHSALEEIRTHLGEVQDAERALSRISANTNNPRDLIIIYNFINKAEKTFEILANQNKKVFVDIIAGSEDIKKLNALKKLIIKTIVSAPPNIISNGDIINDKVNNELDKLRNIKNEKKKTIIDLQLKYAEITTINNLKIKFNNIHGYFIEVTNKNSLKISDNEDIKFNLVQNTVNSSRFQTDELVKISKQINESEQEALELEKRIYFNLCEQIQKFSNTIDIFSNKIAFIDVITNFAYLAIVNNYIKPTLEKKIKVIEIFRGRHPVVEESLKKEVAQYVSNDCLMNNNENLWLMTGPNMAGKSTFLRQVAITILMNQIGSFVPAESARLSVFDKIFTRIGASDNLSKGLSTFMVEMIETSRIINSATESSFVILDELGRGTSTEDGLAISQAVLEYIHTQIDCTTLFATHFKELCEFSADLNRVKLKTMKIKRWKNEIIFLYEVIDGIAEGSFGIHVAKLAGLKSELVERSKKILSTSSQINKGVENKPFIDESMKSERKENSHEDLINFLRSVELDNISPKESLDILYTLRKNYLS